MDRFLGLSTICLRDCKFMRENGNIILILLKLDIVMKLTGNMSTLAGLERASGAVPEDAISRLDRVWTRLGFSKKAFSIPSAADPGRSTSFFYCHCKSHGYYQTYVHGGRWLECPTCENKRLQTFRRLNQSQSSIPQNSCCSESSIQ